MFISCICVCIIRRRQINSYVLRVTRVSPPVTVNYAEESNADIENGNVQYATPVDRFDQQNPYPIVQATVVERKE